jgi:hypothetical protein
VSRREAARWWSLLGYDEDGLIEVRTLTAGASRSAVYRLLVDPANDGARSENVMKVASGKAYDERARREVLFYRHLAAQVPVMPPRAAMLAAYARARGIPNDATLDQAAVAAELMLLLLAWPPYLLDGPEAARARLLSRLEYLLGAWYR